jgi:hypothetical protein
VSRSRWQSRDAALGIRVAVHDSRQNDPNPHVWQAGQDYRMADAIQAARTQPTRTRRGRNASAPNANHQQYEGAAPWQPTTTPPSSAT